MIEKNSSNENTSTPWIWEKRVLPENWTEDDLIPNQDWEIEKFEGLQGILLTDFLMRFVTEADSSLNTRKKFDAFILSKLQDKKPVETYLLVEQENQLWEIDIHRMSLSLEENSNLDK
jgi:hypothetical protein